MAAQTEPKLAPNVRNYGGGGARAVSLEKKKKRPAPDKKKPAPDKKKPAADKKKPAAEAIT